MTHGIVKSIRTSFAKLSCLLPLSLLLFLGSAAHATTITLNFESFADSTNLTTQYSGVTFTNAIVLISGIGLNELEFPPHSGVNVIADNGGPIDIAFSTPVSSVNAYFTYSQPVEIMGYDSANNLLATASSRYSANDAILGDAGSSPNENIAISSNSGISNIQIVGSNGGGSYALDDLTFSSSVPEIDADSGGGACALLSGILLILRERRRTVANVPSREQMRKWR